jgi:dolichol-phosphate mannosyltransferase
MDWTKTKLGSAVVVVPTYNEKENIGPLVEQLTNLRASLAQVDLQVLFVDDSSPDGTGAEVEEMKKTHGFIRLLSRKEKKGIGTAYLDGFRYASENLDPKVFVELDADLQHPPDKVRDLLGALDGGADAAVASRYVEGGGQAGWSWQRRLVSKGANWLARTILGLHVKDCTSGFRAFDRSAVEEVLRAKIPTSGYAFQVATLYVLKKRGLRTVEVPYTFGVRKRGSSKLTFAETVRFFGQLLWLRFKGF